MQLNQTSKRILQLIITGLVIATFITSLPQFSQSKPDAPVNIAPEKMLSNKTCSPTLLKESINNYNCYLFLLRESTPKKPLDESYILFDSGNPTLNLDSSYFFNNSLSIFEHLVHQDVVSPLKEMFEAAKSEQIDLKIFSAYRDIETQKRYPNSLKVPIGRDENQTGFAIDFTTAQSSAAVFQTSFAQTKEGAWLAANSYKYGFVLRYPKDKEDVTKVPFSPWHYRYLGKEIAQEMTTNKWSYEEWLKSKGVTYQA